MPKRIAAFFIIFAIVISAGVSAQAAYQNSVFSVVSAYYHDGIISAYVNPQNVKKSFGGKASVTVGKKVVKDELFRTPGNSAATIDYMLLVDASSSMLEYQDRIKAFVQTLLDEEKSKSKRVTVAVFGSKLKIIAKKLKKPSRVMSAINKIKYDREMTDISGNVANAVKYLSHSIKGHEELANLIVITDGIPYLDNNDNPYEKIENSAKKVKKLIKATPEVAVHTVGFGTWHEPTIEALSSGTGINVTAADVYESAAAGKQLAKFVQNLYMLSFPIDIDAETKRFDASFNADNADKAVAVSGIANIDARSKVKSGTKSTTKSKTETSASHASKATQPASSTVNSESNKTKLAARNNGFTLWIILAAAAAVVIIAAVTVFALTGKRGAKKSRDAIEIKLEVINGNCLNSGDTIYLKDELFIGRRRSCDIVFDDAALSSVNTRVFISEGVVYIEDVGGRSNTAIGEMKIYSRNRLRSGDEIRAGNSAFVLRF